MLAQGLHSARCSHHPAGMTYPFTKSATCLSRLHTLKASAITGTGPRKHVRSHQAVQAQASPSHQQQGHSQSEPEAFTPLTKARKVQKQPNLVATPSQQDMVGSAAGYAAMAADAGAAITAMAVNASQAAVAAGAAVLPSGGKGVNRRARSSGMGGAAPLFGAMSRGMSAAHNFTRALRGRSSQPASMQRLAATSQQAAGETASADSDVIQPLEIEVVYEPFDHEQHYEADMVRRMLEEFRDEEWKKLAKVIAREPCQVTMDDAIHFAEQFDPSYQLIGETVYPTPHSSQHIKTHSDHSADHPLRKDKLKHKEKKKRKKKRKA